MRTTLGYAGVGRGVRDDFRVIIATTALPSASSCPGCCKETLAWLLWEQDGKELGWHKCHSPAIEGVGKPVSTCSRSPCCSPHQECGSISVTCSRSPSALVTARVAVFMLCVARHPSLCCCTWLLVPQWEVMQLEKATVGRRANGLSSLPCLSQWASQNSNGRGRCCRSPLPQPL